MESQNQKSYDYLLKILLIGDSGVGKPNILRRFAEESFHPTFITTIGIDFKIKQIEMDGKKIKLQIWDTAGQERFSTITTSYYRGTNGVMLVYDVTNKKSFENVQKWIKDIEEYGPPDAVKMLLGNKCDLEDQRVVLKEEGEKVAVEYGMHFFEVSAKANINIDEAFFILASHMKCVVDGKKAAAEGNADNVEAPGTDTKSQCILS